MAVHEAGGFLYDDDGNVVGALGQAADGSIAQWDPTPRGAEGFFEEAERILGSRCLFTDWGDTDDRGDVDGVRVIVLDLTGSDTAALEAMAAEVGMSGRVRIEGVDAAQLALWERLRDELAGLRERRPPVLQLPPWRSPFRPAPVEVRLTEASMAVAAELERAYGDYVDLRVGALRFKDGTLSRHPDFRPWDDGDRQIARPDTLSVLLNGPLVVASGGRALHEVLLTNHTATSMTIWTGRQIIAHIINSDDEIVGGYIGPTQDIAVRHGAPPGQTTSVEVLISTTSFDSDLGPSIPPGPWRITIPLDVHRDGTVEQLISPPLDFTISEPDERPH